MEAILQGSRLHAEGTGASEPWAPSGLAAVPHLQWGAHVAHFYASGDELRDVLVPFFTAGLDNNEQCLWIAGEPFTAGQARAAMRESLADFDAREAEGQIEFIDGDEWYASHDSLAPAELAGDLFRRERDALAAGYAGLRANGNCAHAAREHWGEVLEYEGLIQRDVRDRRVIGLCSYCAGDLHGAAQIDIMQRHDMALPTSSRSAPQPGLRQELERQKRTFDMAMIASQMGTWRYTLADNVCVYDDNAQRLYGLTEARFLHDEEGVKAKFHADDMALMWERVGKALDPAGDGRYDVEYRVRQLDGSWRWLSAWGLVEFEGEGAERKPVAIAGASRDLTERKSAEELQRLLLNELNHRVKNTLATMQAISSQTLKAAADLPSAREALDRRIISMARAHDLLTARDWTGANLTDVIGRALEAFPPQVDIAGEAVEISPRHTLALSLALHELATNATKYGALSAPEGRTQVRWAVRDGLLRLEWEESGGPPVTPPSEKGFGSRLLEQLLAHDLGGEITLDYAPAGLRCSITAAL